MSLSNNNYPAARNLQLAISVIIIIPVALAYGLDPKIILFKLFDIKVDNNNLANIFRAMMGLYLGIAAIWILGIFNPKYWLTATITNIAFMGSLGLGRILSLILDGFPSKPFITGLLVEMILFIWGLINLENYRRRPE